MKHEEAETLTRFDLWFAIKLHTNNHVPFMRAVLKTESNDFKRGWTMAMVMVSQWLTDVANGHYDNDKHGLKFDTLEALQDKWNKLHEKEKEK